MREEMGVMSFQSESEEASRGSLLDSFRSSKVSEDQILGNLGLYLDAKNLSRILLMDALYKKIIDVQGVVMDFGTRWGQNMVLFQTLRGIYEPFNRHRRVIGFDTFTGFPSVTPEDGESELMFEGNLKVSEDYVDYLRRLLRIHEQLNPLSHIQKNDIVQGDASVELGDYLLKNPHTVVAMAYFDFDIYQPTKKCLELLSDRVTRGSVLAFDEVNDQDSPGETVALMEVFGLRNIRLERFRYASRVSYFIVD